VKPHDPIDAIRRKAVEDGAFAFMYKPFDPGDLLAAVNQAMSNCSHVRTNRGAREKELISRCDVWSLIAKIAEHRADLPREGAPWKPSLYSMFSG
jgi:DNA-binding NtrC family response regulator